MNIIGSWGSLMKKRASDEELVVSEKMCWVSNKKSGVSDQSSDENLGSLMKSLGSLKKSLGSLMKSLGSSIKIRYSDSTLMMMIFFPNSKKCVIIFMKLLCTLSFILTS